MDTTLQRMLKRVLALLTVAVIVVCIMSTQYSPAGAANNSIVRVKLSVGSTSSLSFSLNGNYGIEADASKTLTSGSYTAKAEGGVLNLYSGAALIASGSSVKVVERAPASGSYNYASVKTSTYGTNKYRGDIELRLSGGNVIVINHIYLEYYLYGVVPHEMNNSWPLEALKAQAVAARTYAVRYMGSGIYDVVDTPSNQAYKGYNPSYTNAIRAVDETAKTVLTCNGALVQTYYSASNGGYTDIPQHVWSSNAALQPYHVVAADPFDTQNTWSLQEVLIFPKTISGSDAIAYQYMDSGKMVAGSGTQSTNAARYMKMSALPALAAKGYIANVTSDMQIVGVSRIVPHTYIGNHGLPDFAGQINCADFYKADVTMTVLASRVSTPQELNDTGKPYTEEQTAVTFTIDLNKLSEAGGLYQAFTNTSLRLVTVEETNTGWNIYHRRYGHGVGLSQRGAQQRAKAGQTYKDILSFYYPNTVFEVLNIAPPAAQAPADPGTGNAVIINCASYVNVRSTPDTQYPAIGKALAGARVTVTQAEAAPGWHKIDFGGVEAYISAQYIQLDPAATATPAPAPTAAPTAAPSPTETAAAPTATPPPAETVMPTETAAPTTAVSPAPSEGIAPVILQTGKVKTNTLNVRSGPGTTFAKVGSLVLNDTVCLTEAGAAGGWHKILIADQTAYVFADYIDLNKQTTGVITASVLNVRSGPGTTFGTLGSLAKGAKVEIVRANETAEWHKVLYNGGMAYLNASYVSLGTSGGTGDTGTGGGADTGSTVYASVNASALNFRKTADLQGAVIQKLSRGDVVQVLEKGATWCRVKYGGATGYVYSKYLKLSTAAYGKVSGSVLNVRSGGSATSTILGKLSAGDIVEIVSAGGTWHKIRYKSSTAYVYAAYIKLQ